jgi:SAM-dependent methyltransferase
MQKPDANRPSKSARTSGKPSIPAVCRGCAQEAVELLLDLGAQPPSNRFLNSIEDRVERHPLRAGLCRSCGLLQLIDPMPVSITRPRIGWLRYNEPEAHLDAVCEQLRGLPDMPAQPRVFGVSYKDDSTLARLARSGAQTYRFDLAQDWNVREPHAQLESLQQAVTPQVAAALAQRHGRADVLIARHVLEHAHQPRVFLAALLELVKPGGHVIFEVPGAEKMIGAADHALLWEEHVAYFTAATLERFFAAAGVPASLSRYPYVLEDSLVAFVRNAPAGTQARATAAAAEIEASQALGKQFEALRAGYHRQLAAWRALHKHVALFGAGHLALKFVNLYGLSDLIDCVIDDNPQKQGTYLPGSCLPVVSSSILQDGRIDFCLLALNPDREAAVIASQPHFAARGGHFLSIFRCSPIALQPSTISRR